MMYPRTHTTSLSALSPHWEALHRFGQNQPNILQFASESNRWAGRQDATAHMVDGIHHGCQSPRAPSKSAIHPTHGTVAAPPHRQLPPTHHFANTAPVYLSCLKKKKTKTKQPKCSVHIAGFGASPLCKHARNCTAQSFQLHTPRRGPTHPSCMNKTSLTRP